MKTSLDSEQLTFRVRDIPLAGKHLELELDEAGLVEIIGGAQDVYQTVGQGLRAEVDLSRTGENVFVRGRITAPMVFNCCRCLKANSRPLEVSVNWTFLPREAVDQKIRGKDELELDADDLDVSFYQGEVIELGLVLREVVLLDLAPYPTCPDGCEEGAALASLAPEAGDRAQEMENGKPIDPRWAPLASLKGRRTTRKGSD